MAAPRENVPVRIAITEPHRNQAERAILKEHESFPFPASCAILIVNEENGATGLLQK